MPGASNSDQRAHESARDLAKLIISLSSGIIAISATFVEKHTQGVRLVVVLLAISWILLIVSIFYGIKALITLVNAEQQDAQNWWGMTRIPLRIAWNHFRAGVVTLTVYAFVVSVTYAFDLSKAATDESARPKKDVTSAPTTLVPEPLAPLERATMPYTAPATTAPAVPQEN